MLSRSHFIGLAAALVSCSACSSQNKGASLRLEDFDTWNYDGERDVYWIFGLAYCENPADEAYETLGLMVSGELARNRDAASQAPMVIPVVTGGYAAMPSPNSSDYEQLYIEAEPYLQSNMVYVRCGCRGREHGAPAGVTDLKAAVRWLRAHKEELPGNTDAIFTFGHSGGGAQSALVGASGNNALWEPYLEAIGAAAESDAIAGAMCWCPVTSLGIADAAYEWMMGQYCLDGRDAALSHKLAAQFAPYVEENFGYGEDEYTNLLLDVISGSLNTWLADNPGAKVDEAWDWVEQSSDGSYRVVDLAGFVRARKVPDKPVPAFDRKDLSSPENQLFGDAGKPLHFNENLAGEGFDTSFVDEFGFMQAARVALYDPLTYLIGEQAGKSDVAPHWRISSGLRQPDTALTAEYNLARALENSESVQDVFFQTVWDKAHIEAECTGTPEENCINWIRECCGDATLRN